MSAKIWSAKEVRAIAHKEVDGRKTIKNARGEYLRALVETTQTELEGNTDPETQRRTLSAVQERFVGYATEAIAADEILLLDGVSRKSLATVRNRRLNFARTSYAAVRCWLRVPGHDLLKLDALKVTKGKLLKDGAPSHKHAMTKERIDAHADKYIKGLLGFTEKLGKDDQVTVLSEAVQMICRRLKINVNDLRVHGKPFLKLVA